MRCARAHLDFHQARIGPGISLRGMPDICAGRRFHAAVPGHGLRTKCLFDVRQFTTLAVAHNGTGIHQESLS